MDTLLDTDTDAKTVYRVDTTHGNHILVSDSNVFSATLDVTRHSAMRRDTMEQKERCLVKGLVKVSYKL